jgi:hypothetical protein
LFFDSTGNKYETQSSAFTESLRSTVISDSYNVLQQQISITSLENKTQNISSATSTVTNMNKPLYITSVDALRLYGNHSYISGWANTGNTRDWYFGTRSPNVKNLFSKMAG